MYKRQDFNQNTNQNILILNSKKDWLFTFEKNTENQFDLSALKKLRDFNKYTLKKNEDIYSIYSKDILEEKNDAIKQLTFENIYSIESGGLQFISNFLIDNKKLEIISKKFFNLKSYKDNYQVSIFTEIKNFEKYLKPFLNNFEQSFFKDFNQNTNQNILILNSKKDWLFTFEKNTENQFDLSSLKKLKDFNKYTLKQNEDIYSIYSKDILEEKNDAIKQLTFENIYSIESGGLQFISNCLLYTSPSPRDG